MSAQILGRSSSTKEHCQLCSLTRYVAIVPLGLIINVLSVYIWCRPIVSQSVVADVEFCPERQDCRIHYPRTYEPPCLVRLLLTASPQFLDEADLLADTIAVLAAPGKLVAHGTPVSLKSSLGEGYTVNVSFNVHPQEKSSSAHQGELLGRIQVNPEGVDPEIVDLLYSSVYRTHLSPADCKF